MFSKISIALVALLAVTIAGLPSYAEVLQGNVTKSGTTRLERPSGPPQSADGPPVAPSRLARPIVQKLQAEDSGIVDPSAFKPLQGQARQEDLRMGLAKPDQFDLPRGFDLGAERGSKELMLAWERWHKQFSQAIYERWSAVADEPGRATVRVTVTKDRQIMIAFLNSTGSRRFDNELRTVIEGLQGNPGLSFPSKSLRTQVSFEADYIAAHNVMPGYSWVKDDYEKVKQNY